MAGSDVLESSSQPDLTGHGCSNSSCSWGCGAIEVTVYPRSGLSSCSSSVTCSSLSAASLGAPSASGAASGINNAMRLKNNDVENNDDYYSNPL